MLFSYFLHSFFLLKFLYVICWICMCVSVINLGIGQTKMKIYTTMLYKKRRDLMLLCDTRTSWTSKNFFHILNQIWTVISNESLSYVLLFFFIYIWIIIIFLQNLNILLSVFFSNDLFEMIWKKKNVIIMHILLNKFDEKKVSLF